MVFAQQILNFWLFGWRKSAFLSRFALPRFLSNPLLVLPPIRCLRLEFKIFCFDSSHDLVGQSLFGIWKRFGRHHHVSNLNCLPNRFFKRKIRCPTKLAVSRFGQVISTHWLRSSEHREVRFEKKRGYKQNANGPDEIDSGERREPATQQH